MARGRTLRRAGDEGEYAKGPSLHGAVDTPPSHARQWKGRTELFVAGSRKTAGGADTASPTKVPTSMVATERQASNAPASIPSWNTADLIEQDKAFMLHPVSNLKQMRENDFRSGGHAMRASLVASASRVTE